MVAAFPERWCSMKRGVLLVLLLAGCNSQEPGANAQYGSVPANYKSVVVRRLAFEQRAPQGAEFRFEEPVKVWRNDPAISGGRVNFTGYVIPFEVNGGGTGFKPWMCLWRDGELRECADRAVSADRSIHPVPILSAGR